MKSLFTLIIAVIAFAGINAQELPKPSPNAEVEQTVGLTNVKIQYSRPGVKDRIIWGQLVPYNEIWRAGANKATSFEISDDIQINGITVPAGKYSLFIIPKEYVNWTIILNKDTELWGTTDYKQENDQLRFEAPVKVLNEKIERLEYRFLNVTENSTIVTMDWELVRLSFEIVTDPGKKAMANIDKAISESKPEDLWRVYRNAASFAEEQGNMTDKGLEWIKKSVELKENWYAYWVYGSLLAQKGNKNEAVAMAEKAKKLGIEDAKANNREFTYTKSIDEDIAKWKK